MRKRSEIINKIIINIQNAAITLIVFSGISNIVLSLPYKFKMVKTIGKYYRILNPEYISIHRTFSTLAGFILLLISFRLYKRMRMAWVLALCILPVSLILHVLRFHNYINIFTFSESLIIIVLSLSYKDFHRASSPLRLKAGITIASISVFLVLLNTAVGLFILKNEFKHIYSFADGIIRSIQLLFFMDISMIEPKTRTAVLFCKSAIILNWVCIITAIILILKPLVYQPIVSRMGRERVHDLLRSYGFNPISYVALEEDKLYFFGSSVNGVIAYTLAAGVAVCAGDPICKIEDAIILLSEFITFCRQNDLDICFCQVSDKLLHIYKEMGFGITKYGEEAMFELSTYSTAGGAAAKTRQAVNKANRLGINVYEYDKSKDTNRTLEKEIMDVSHEWLHGKKSSELSFMLGSVSFENPEGRRYFYATDASGVIQGFVVFVPFAGGSGYYADVTRRRLEAPIGVMEKIIISAFETMKGDGVEWGSLGLAPLANVRESDPKKTVGLVLEFIYEHLNNFYGFKTLYQYKKKYAPTHWQPRYLSYYPKSFTPKIAYSIIKAQNPKGVKDYLLTQIKQIFAGKK
ncbi:MAG: phosphatidylglycerol lysyltransferase domain-containing protein [Bacillota bacterium]|nr:phosphatidylglycerol lysyltransferase domain-containing protein [Bacillota bacterium]